MSLKELVSFIVFADDKRTIKQKFVVEDSNFNLVVDGRNFHRKFKHNRTPITLILDKEQKAIDWYN